MRIAISALSAERAKGSLRGCVYQTEMLKKNSLFQTNLFFFSKTTIATLYTARNLLPLPPHNQILNLYYKGAIHIAL